jgi:Fe-S-cluster-containing dehydrogenase component/DMSO reductase anchor subunit
MRNGFAFDSSLCVGCQACNVACTLENGFQPGTRSVFTWNERALPLLNVINLSMACNHCEKPACAERCPARAYSIEDSGVVVHHAERCMGCGYCTWQCPYDAPSVNKALGYIEKCHMCTSRAAENVSPACITACPTGALKLTGQDEFETVGAGWFPDKSLRPSIVIRGAENLNRPAIFPEEADMEEEDEMLSTDAGPGRVQKEWSLVLFSILVIAASAMLVIYALTGAGKAARTLPFLMMAGAMSVSMAHLGVPLRSWRAVTNVLSSPLSREIIMVTTLTILALVHWIRPGLIPPLLTAVVALMTLISIDLVYFNADRTTLLRLHSGQAFFTAICAVSWFMEPGTLFLVFSMLAAASVVIRYRTASKNGIISNIYYFRALALPVVFMLLYPGSTMADVTAMILFMAGLVADRLLFYYDFNPVNIKETMKTDFTKEYEYRTFINNKRTQE